MDERRRTLKPITFVVRHDYKNKPGGDVDLAHTYVSMLKDAGIEATITPSDQVVPEQLSYVVLFNLDQPFEAYCVAQQCVQAGLPYGIYTLHHKRYWTDLFLRYGTRGKQRLIAQLMGGSSSNYETIVGGLRQLRGASIGQLLQMRSAATMQKYLLEHAASVLVSCEAEAACIEKDFALKLKHVTVIQHYFSKASLASVPSVNDGDPIDLLCAGRIEPRKNQLSLAKYIAESSDRSMVFVGKKNLRHGAYLEEFDRVVAACPRLRWVDHVSKETLHAYLRSCNLYINVSWFEVFSLIDLIALQNNCRCVLSRGSYLFDAYHGEDEKGVLSFIAPSKLSDLQELLSVNASKPANPRPLPEAVIPDAEYLVGQWKSVFGVQG